MKSEKLNCFAGGIETEKLVITQNKTNNKKIEVNSVKTKKLNNAKNKTSSVKTKQRNNVENGIVSAEITQIDNVTNRASSVKIKRLNELKKGESGVVVSVSGDVYIRRRLLELGLISGTKVSVLGVSPLKNTYLISLRDYSLALRKNSLELVSVACNE